MKLIIGDAQTESAFLTVESGHDVARIERITGEGWPDLEPGNYLTDEGWQELIDRIHGSLVACHGLAIPATVPPGALAALVDAARAAEKMLSGIFREIDLPGEWETGTGDSIDAIRAALAPFTPAPDPVPVSPPEPEAKPYGYAVKTEKGYLARQGTSTWYEAEPVGWALFAEEAGARACSPFGSHVSAEVVPVYR